MEKKSFVNADEGQTDGRTTEASLEASANAKITSSKSLEKSIICEQRTKVVQDRRKNLLPKMASFRNQRKRAVLVRDKLFVDGVELKRRANRPKGKTIRALLEW